MLVRDVQVTDDDRGPVVKIISWIVLVAIIVATIVKVFTKLLMIQKVQIDDFLILGLMLSAVGQVVAVSYQVDAGLGRHEGTMAGDGSFMKTALGADILYSVALYLGRLAVSRFLYNISGTDRFRQRTVKAFAALDTTWIAVTILVLAFQCSVPRTWAVTANCINISAFWIAFGVINLLLDITLICLPLYILQNLQVTKEKKAPIIRIFLARTIVFPLIILRIIFIAMAYQGDDLPFALFGASLTTEIHLGAATVLSCAVFLKPVLDNLQSGVFGGDFKSIATAAAVGSTGSRSKKTNDQVLATIRSVELEDEISTPRPWESRNFTTSISGSKSQQKPPGRAGSASSRDPMIIRQVTTIELREEEGSVVDDTSTKSVGVEPGRGVAL